MNPRLARWMYSAWLFSLAACAVIVSPPSEAPAAPAGTVAASVAPETELARAVRERAELAQRYDARHPEVIRAAETEASLREAAAAQDRGQFRHALVLALSDELADAMRKRREIAARGGHADPELRVAQGVILALTAAINREVNSAG